MFSGESLQPLLFFLAAACGGAINAVAGGGSFLLFPTLLMGGMSPVAANVMCTVALWPGSVASSYAYWRQVRTPFAAVRGLVVCCLFGGVVGASALLYFPEEHFAALVPWLLLCATLIFTFGRRVVVRLRRTHVVPPVFVIYGMMVLIAVYGGYFGAGIGILMLAMLQLAGHSHMHEMNALKTLFGSVINAVALVLFVVAGAVQWEWASVLIAGGVTGGYVGTKLALRTSPEYVRRVVILIAFSMTAYFFLQA